MNTTSKSEIITLPGIDPALAKKIITSRVEFGEVMEINQLMNVKGIGGKSVTRFLGQIEL